MKKLPLYVIIVYINRHYCLPNLEGKLFSNLLERKENKMKKLFMFGFIFLIIFILLNPIMFGAIMGIIAIVELSLLWFFSTIINWLITFMKNPFNFLIIVLIIIFFGLIILYKDDWETKKDFVEAVICFSIIIFFIMMLSGFFAYNS